MGAGIMLMEDLRNWMYIAKADPSTSGKLQVTACEEGWSANVANIAWTGLSNAFLRVERNSTGFWMYSSADDADWTLIYHMAPTVEMAQRLLVGLVVYSASSSLPVVDFDYLRVEPAGAVANDVLVRVGNWTEHGGPVLGRLGARERVHGGRRRGGQVLPVQGLPRDRRRVVHARVPGHHGPL